MTWGSHAANRGKDWCHLLRQYTFRKCCILGASTYRLVSWKMNKMWAAGVVLLELCVPPMAPNADCSSFNLLKHWVCASALSSGSVDGALHKQDQWLDHFQQVVQTMHKRQQLNACQLKAKLNPPGGWP